MIRVFARKTSMTPTDDLAFYDEPPLYELPDLPVCVSVTFTWDIAKGHRLDRAWAKRCKYVALGGPAFGNPGGEFITGMFLKKGITITSRGCPKSCRFCLASKREGGLRELEIKPGNIVQDNNLLACSRSHIEKVFEMLSHQKAIQFKGGLDIDYLKEWHIESFKNLSIDEMWVACDSEKDLARLDKARDLLADFPINKKRCYVLIAYNEETILQAEKRCERVYKKGFLPFAQLYQPTIRKIYSWEWTNLARKWSRPAIYKAQKGTNAQKKVQ